MQNFIKCQEPDISVNVLQKDLKAAGLCPGPASSATKGNELRQAPPGQRLHKETIDRRRPMQDARYLRAQAALCLEIADQMSDPKAREKMRADAAEFHVRAAALEEGKEMPRVLK